MTRPAPPPRTRIAAAAVEAGFNNSTFIDACVAAGIARRTASRYWSGATEPPRPALAIIARIVGSADYLLELTDDLGREDESAATAPPVDSGALDVLVDQRRRPRAAGGRGQP